MSEQCGSAEPARAGAALSWFILVAALALLCVLLLRHLSFPLLWQDEAETAMFGQRVLEYGYPKVHDGRNVVYGMGIPLPLAVREEADAYIGSLWGQYYLAAFAVRLAQGTEDLYAKTALLRLPFALIGCLGLGLLYLAVSADFARFCRRRSSRPLPAAAFVLLLCSSTSLLLHLREVRYYALVVALSGAIVALEFHRPSASEATAKIYAGARILALVLLFNTFYPAAVALVIWIALESAFTRSLRNFIERSAPALVACLLFVPVASYFEIDRLARIFSARYDFGIGEYLRNCGLILHYLLRYEWLAPALLFEFASAFVARRNPSPQQVRDGDRTSRQLLRLCLVWSLVGARNPIFFERYFVALSPVLSLVLLLAAGRLWRFAREEREGGSRRWSRRQRTIALACCLGFAGMLVMKWGEFSGRIAEISEPCRGALDFAIPYLKQRYDDPSQLVIATNYEGEAYMFYLGSRVVGRPHAESAARIARDLATRADWVIPRSGQPRGLENMSRRLRRARFERHPFPVLDLPYNAIPELFEGRVLQATHRFRTAVASGDDERAFAIYERVDSSPRSAANASPR